MFFWGVISAANGKQARGNHAGDCSRASSPHKTQPRLFYNARVDAYHDLGVVCESASLSKKGLFAMIIKKKNRDALFFFVL